MQEAQGTKELVMLIYGTGNPAGYSENYDGVYLTDQDIRDMAPTMPGTPVKIEHRGNPIGKVISAWQNPYRGGAMDLVAEIDEKLLTGMFAKEFIERKLVKDFSLGYSIQMSAQPGGRVSCSGKSIVEVSIVRKGARENCHIRAW